MAEYMNCGTDDERSDFYSINDYSWCDPSSFTTSGWDTLVANYSSYGIPLFMSEYGCIANTRTFEEVSALYSTNMTDVFSGGLVYEYSNEGNGYGLVTISGSTVSPLADFTALESAFKNTPNPTGLGGAMTSSPASSCPPQSAEWEVANDNLPAMPKPAQAYLQRGAGTGPGLQGSGSQDAGTTDNESSGTASAGSGSVTASATGSASTHKNAGARVPPVDGSAFSVLCTVFLSLVGGMALF